ncbi:MAG: ATP-binding cassette domain-containing protein [Bacillota bacterium]
MSETKLAVKISELTWQYSDTKAPALKNINIEIPENCFVGLTGPNESGKTTLVSCIKGLIPRNFNGSLLGKIELFGQDVKTMSAVDLAQTVGFVFADPEAQFTAMSVEEELAFGMENIGLSIDEIRERIKWVSQITMIENLLDKSPYDISGGQKQRVAIASVLAMRPRIIIMDEPTSMLDPFGKDSVFEICEKMKEELNMTVIMVEHTIDRLARLCDKMILIHEGEIKKYAEPVEFFDNIEEIIEYGLNAPDPMIFIHKLRKAGYYKGNMKTELKDVIKVAREALDKHVS